MSNWTSSFSYGGVDFVYAADVELGDAESGVNGPPEDYQPAGDCDVDITLIQIDCTDITLDLDCWGNLELALQDHARENYEPEPPEGMDNEIDEFWECPCEICES